MRMRIEDEEENYPEELAEQLLPEKRDGRVDPGKTAGGKPAAQQPGEKESTAARSLSMRAK